MDSYCILLFRMLSRLNANYYQKLLLVKLLLIASVYLELSGSIFST